MELLLLLYSRLGDTGFHQGLSKDTFVSVVALGPRVYFKKVV